MLMSGESVDSIDVDHINLFNDFSSFRQNDPKEKPSINRTLTPVNITGQLGATVYLHCVVHRRAQKTVTWLRRSDYHILTVGLHTYTTDNRFSASSARVLRGTVPGYETLGMPTATLNADGLQRSLPDDPEDWMLQIRGVAKADAGEYECQINTQLPLISAHITLNVLAPHASIVEAPELYVNSGSTIALTCVIHDCPQPLTHIFWYHQDKVVNYERHVNITMERPGSRLGDDLQSMFNSWAILGGSASRSESPWIQVSKLLIPVASAEHSGKYTCAPVDSTPAVVHVHVLHAEEHLARKSPSSSSTSSASSGNSVVTGVSRPESWALSYLHTSLPLLALELFFLLVVARAT
ncbi:uncharacterized protein LOC111249795 isoform X2 [Varroa destructor]|nr:uncharacterized protein LOC111249795 isoform X2 [Varroa destructor]XP_022659851.1 uncharacterized protein LOC111249795 isoform X2 [Varroa destructor]